MSLIVSSVEKNSISDRIGIIAGDELLSVNNDEIIDIIDYEYFLGKEKLSIIINRNGSLLNFTLKKSAGNDIGLVFFKKNIEVIKCCKNKCRFCFVDQMPKGLRKSLYIKDDDWRTSFLFGNYVTLTNVTDLDIERIIKRKVSPMYISVHATDDTVRNDLLFQKKSNECIMDKLKILADNNIRMNAQVVLCPGFNDGSILEKTIEDLFSLYPSVMSLAVVPVGLTKFRDGLSAIQPVDTTSAIETVSIIEKYATRYFNLVNSHFVYAADELYIRAGIDIPPYERYDDFSQLENGVGMIADFIDGVNCAISDIQLLKYKEISIATGVDFYPFMCKIAKTIESYYNIIINVYRITNEFFGHSVTVTGLLTVTDILNQLNGVDLGEVLVLSESIFNKSGISLDGYTLDYIVNHIKHPCILASSDGYEFFCLLRKD